jgi:two-component system, cell cycle response regulator
MIEFKDFKILLAEDCPIQRAKAKIILKQEGFNVRTVDNGKSALEIVLNDSDEWKPDIILTDIHMPEMDGLTLTSNILKYNKSIRSIVLTATAGKDALSDAFDHGAIDFIRKPIEKFELLARIKSSLEIIVAERELKKALAELEEKNIILEKLSTEDSLTGLLNRRAFYEILSSRLYDSNRYTWPLSIFMFDIDDFKQINDTYGHIVGDVVLKSVAEVLTTETRKTDFACRYGGDEFIILLTNSDLGRSKIISAKFRTKILEIKLTAAPDLKIKISGGIYQYDGEKSEEAFIGKVDKFLYSAKVNGKNRIEG